MPTRLFTGIITIVVVAGLAFYLNAQAGTSTPRSTFSGGQGSPQGQNWPEPLSPVPACDVTAPTGGTPPGETNPVQNAFSQNGIWVGLYPDGTVMFTPGGPGSVGADGTLGMQFWWWRPVKDGKLEITGHRLDAPAPPLQASIPAGYDGQYFQATGLSFPTQGCWEVTGRVGDATLRFVTLVLVER